MTQHHVSSLLDSKVVTLDRYGENRTQHHILKLRIIMMYKMLMNDIVVVPQGWALDSLPFFQVMGEIQKALQALIDASHCPEEINDFHPVKMQVHMGERTYPDVLSAYLRRNDCRWSGMPILSSDAELRNALLETTLKVVDRPYDGRGIFEHGIREILSHEKIARNWGLVMDYFIRFPKKRILAQPMRENAYYKHFVDSLTALEGAGYSRNSGVDSSINLRNFLQTLKNRQSSEINSVSKILSMAEEIMPEGELEVIIHFSTFAQIWASAETVHAQASTPELLIPLTRSYPSIQAIVDRSIDAQHQSEIEIRQHVDMASPLVHKLSHREMDWHSVWSDVIRVSVEKHWRTLIAELANSDPLHRSKIEGIWRKMEAYLERECKDLLIHQSAVERFGISIRSKKLKSSFAGVNSDFVSASLAYAAGALGGYLIGIDVGASATAGVLTKSFGKYAQEVAPHLTPNIIADRSLLSKRTSIIRVVK